MGNCTSGTRASTNDSTDLTCLPHFTFVVPIFGHPVHTNAFILGSRSANTVHNLFGDFILAPWFENISSKMSNEMIFDVFGGPERPPQEWAPDPASMQVLYPNSPRTKAFALKDPLNNHSYRCDPNEYEDSGCDDAHDDDSALLQAPAKGKSRYPTAPIIINDYDCDDPNPLLLPWAAQRIELDTATIPTLRPQPVGHAPSLTPSPSPESIALDPNAPVSVPFIKIASLSYDYNLKYPGGSHLWFGQGDLLHADDRTYLITMRDHIFPLRGITSGKYWDPQPYMFDNQKPFMGTGGDGERTEKDIFAGHIYPRTSFFRVEPTVGYDFQRVSNIPHISDVPMKHLATILILDVASDTALLTLYHFIRETVTFLTKGSILALTDVNLYIISLNANQIDSRVISDEEITNQLSRIGFTPDRIHFTPFKPSRYFTRHLPVIKQRPTWRFDVRSLSQIHFSPDEPPKITPPLLTRRDLKRFSAPLWNQVYTHLFHLHNTGHWFRLHQTQTGSRLVPPSQYPTLFYNNMLFADQGRTFYSLHLKTFEKGMKDFLQDCFQFPDNDILLGINRIASIAYYKWIRCQTYKMFEPIAIELEKPQLSQSKQDAPTQSTKSDQLYEDLYGTTSPDWDDARSYFVHPFDHLENPLPVPFLINFVPKTHNSDFPLPLQYQHQYTQRLGLVDGVGENSGAIPFVPSMQEEEEKEKSPPQFGDEGNNVAKNGYCFERSLPPKLLSVGTPTTTTTITTATTLPPTPSNSIQSRLGLPSNYEFESFILWGTDALVSDPTGLMTPSYFPQPHSQKVKHKEEAIQAVRRKGFKQVKTQPDDQMAKNTKKDKSSRIPVAHQLRSRQYNQNNGVATQGTLLDPAVQTNLTSVYFAQTVPRRNFIGQRWSIDQKRCTQFIELIGRTVVQFAIREHWGAFYNATLAYQTGLYSNNPPAVPPTLLKIRSNAIPLSYCSSRATWEVENCFEKFGKKMGAVVVETEVCPHEDQGNNQPRHHHQEKQDEIQQSLNLPSQPNGCSLNPLKIKMTYFYRGVDSDTGTFPNAFPPSVSKHSVKNQTGLTRCSYYSHPMASSTPFAPLTWSHGVVVIPFLYIRHRTQRFLELLPSTLSRQLEPGFMDPLDQRHHNPDSVPYPNNFIPPPIPAMRELPYNYFGPYGNSARESPLSSVVSCGVSSLSPDHLVLSSSSLPHYHCPINWIIMIMNPVEPDPIPYCELDPQPILQDALKKTTLDAIVRAPTSNLAVRPTDFPFLVEPITASQHRYFTEVLPTLYKRQLVEELFSPSGLVGVDKLKKLWSVHLCQPETLAQTVHQCENAAVEARLKLYHDFAMKVGIGE